MHVSEGYGMSPEKLEKRVVGVQGTSWPEFALDEWVRGSWPARCLTEANDSDSSCSDGTLMLTNQRLLFTDGRPVDDMVNIRFDDLLAVRCERHRFWRDTLIVETSSGRLFEFRTTKLACKQIEARSHMRQLTTS
jgi:hypothetical protein